MSLPNLFECRVAIIGLGYVGLPLAIEFSRNRDCLITGKSIHRRVLGFDINNQRINELRNGFDRTNEVNTDELSSANNLELSFNINDLEDVDVFIVTVPTPIDSAKRPDLTILQKATKMVANILNSSNNKQYRRDNNIKPITI